MRRVLYAVLGALIVGACLGASGPAEGQDAAVAVQALMNQRRAAILGGDKASFMATLDRSATNEFRDAQSRTFDGLHSIPLSEFSITVRLDDSGDLAAGGDIAKRYGAERAYLPETRQTYEISGYDTTPVVGSLWLTYVLRQGRWFVGGQDDLADIGITSTREFVDLGAVAVQSTEHFIILTRPDQMARGRSLAAIGEDAMAIFQTRWQLPWSERIPIVVPGSREEANSLLTGLVDVANFSAFVAYTPVREEDWSITAPRIYAQDENLLRLPRATQVANLVHELTHAATAQLAGPFTPTWMHEGLAEYVKFNRARPLPPAGHRDRLPLNSDFAVSDADDLRLAYAEAFSAIGFVADRAGPAGPAALFQSVGARRVVPGSPAYNLDLASRQVTGLSLTDFQGAWAAR